MKRVLLVSAVIAAFALFSGSAMADTLQIGTGIGGGMTLSPTSTGNCVSGASSCQQVTFGGLIVANTVPAESFSTSSVSIDGFYLGYNGSGATFNPSSGSFSATIDSSTLNGTINWMSLSATGTGAFALSVGLSNLTGGGTDPILLDFVAANGGLGTLSFQFTAQGITTIEQLISDTSTQSNVSISGTLTDTPEPATLGLLGVGLLGLGLIGIYRKKRMEA